VARHGQARRGWVWPGEARQVKGFTTVARSKSKSERTSGSSQPIGLPSPVEASGVVTRLRELGHDPMAELIKRARGEGDCVHARVEDACTLIGKFTDKIRESHPRDAQILDTLVQKIREALTGIPSGAERDRINMFLVPYQHAAFRPVDPPVEKKGEGEGTFAHAVATVGAKLPN
jgi:hypothetical protein